MYFNTRNKIKKRISKNQAKLSFFHFTHKQTTYTPTSISRIPVYVYVCVQQQMAKIQEKKTAVKQTDRSNEYDNRKVRRENIYRMYIEESFELISGKQQSSEKVFQHIFFFPLAEVFLALLVLSCFASPFLLLLLLLLCVFFSVFVRMPPFIFALYVCVCVCVLIVVCKINTAITLLSLQIFIYRQKGTKKHTLTHTHI